MCLWEIKTRWYNKVTWTWRTRIIKQNSNLTGWVERLIKIKRITRNPTKNKKHYGITPDNGRMRRIHYHPERKSFTRILKLNIQPLELSSS